MKCQWSRWRPIMLWCHLVEDSMFEGLKHWRFDCPELTSVSGRSKSIVTKQISIQMLLFLLFIFKTCFVFFNFYQSLMSLLVACICSWQSDCNEHFWCGKSAGFRFIDVWLVYARFSKQISWWYESLFFSTSDDLWLGHKTCWTELSFESSEYQTAGHRHN